MKSKEKNISEEGQKEPGLEVMGDLMLAMHLQFFADLQRSDPAQAAELKEDFDKWVELQAKLFAADPQNSTVRDVRRQLPGNKWDAYLEGLLAKIGTPNLGKGIVNKDFEERVARKISGTDVQ